MKEGDGRTYEIGKSFAWWTFSSVTTDLDSLERDECLGKEGERTIFHIESTKGVDISPLLNAEDVEVLMPPGCVWRVVSVKREGDLTVIRCQDDAEAPTLIQ